MIAKFLYKLIGLDWIRYVPSGVKDKARYLAQSPVHTGDYSRLVWMRLYISSPSLHFPWTFALPFPSLLLFSLALA